MDVSRREVISPEEHERLLKENEENASRFEVVPDEHALGATRLLNGKDSVVAHKDDAQATAMFRSSRRMKQAIRKKMRK